MKKNIFNLELHESLKFKSLNYREDGSTYYKTFHVIRVSGGWIYKPLSDEDQSIFVPYSEELKKDKYSEEQDDLYV